MHPALINAALEMALPSVSQVEVARHLRVGKALVRDVIRGQRRSEHVERQLAWFTGLKLTELWPQHYGQPTEKPSKALAALRAALR